MPFAEFGAKVTHKGKTCFVRHIYDVEDEENKLASFRSHYNNTDVYRSIFTYEDEDLTESKIKGPLYFDLDFGHSVNQDNFAIRAQTRHCIITIQQYLKVPEKQIRLYYSGGKGFHIIVPSEVFGFDFCDGNKLVKDYRAFATVMKYEWEKRFGTEHYIDLRVYDRRRMFRLPNSFNSTGKGYKIFLPDITCLSTHYADLQDLAQNPSDCVEPSNDFSYIAQAMWHFWTEEVTSPKQRKKKSIKRKDGKMLPCVEAMLHTPVSKGNRNNVTVVLANVLFQMELSFEEVESILTAWNENNEPPLSLQELYLTIKSAHVLYKNEKEYGCSSVRSLGYCEDNCKLGKDKS